MKRIWEWQLRFRPAGQILLGFFAIIALSACHKEPPLNSDGEPSELRVGYFPNVTHAQAIVGVAQGEFQKAVGEGVRIVPETFNAGPAAIEALYAGHIDIAYVGPSPALNGFLQSKGQEVRVIAGSAINGVTVVGNRKRGITRIAQLKGGKIATPQYANTQDISARYFLGVQYGFKLSDAGGKTDIIPISNPDIETLFAKNQIDAAWVPEPWGTRLIKKNLAVEITRESELWEGKSFAITTVIARRDFVTKHPELAARFLQAHIRLTQQLQADAQKFAKVINSEIKRITGKALDDDVLRGALKNTGFSIDPSARSFEQYFQMARDVGIYPQTEFDVQKLLYTGPLVAAAAKLGFIFSVPIIPKKYEPLKSNYENNNAIETPRSAADAQTSGTES